mgnify:CR=1 FL=1
MRNYQDEQNKNYENTKQMFEACRKDVGASKDFRRTIPVVNDAICLQIFRKAACVLLHSLKTGFVEKLSGVGTDKTSICCTAVFAWQITRSGFRWIRQEEVRHYI